MTSHPQPYEKGESVKPTYNELQRIEASFDPYAEELTERVYRLLAIAERPHRNLTGRASG